MKLLFLTIFSIFILAGLESFGSIELKAKQFKDGNEVVIDITIKLDQGAPIPLGGADIPIRIDPSVLDLQNAYIDGSIPSDFSIAADPNSYSAVGLYKNKLLVVRVNENMSGGGSGVNIDLAPKNIARVRIPILDPCAISKAEWEVKWGTINQYTNDAWMTSIKSQVNFVMEDSELELFTNPTMPNLNVVGSTTFCSGSSTLLTTNHSNDFTVVWEKDGVIISAGPDTTFLVTTSGTYRVGYQSCASIEFSDQADITVLETPIKPIVSEDQGTLFSSSLEDNQWYLNGNVLTGSTAASIVPSQSGTYSVEVSNQCGSAMSDDYLYVLSSLGQGIVATKVGVYPNPYFGNSNIYLDLVKDSEVMVEVYDLRGIKVKLIESGFKFAGPHEWRFETSDLGLASGSYIIKIFADGRVYTTTLIEASK